MVYSIQPLKEDKFVIPTSRYDTIDLYLAHPEYNDKEILYEEEDYKKLRDSGKCGMLKYDWYTFPFR